MTNSISYSSRIFLTYGIFILFVILVFSSTSDAGKAHTCSRGAYPPDERHKIQEFVIDLDLSPRLRWRPVLEKHLSGLRQLLETFRTFINGLGFLGSKLLHFIDATAPKLLSSLPQEYSQEMIGIANITKLPLGEIVLFNVFYEFFSVCTSIVARDSKDQLYHVRNMDFGLFMGWNDTAHTWSISHALRPIAVNLDFRKSNKTVYKAISFAGFIGVLTAVRPHNFTFTINQRYSLKGGWLGVLEWVLGNHNQQWLSLLTRQVMEKAKDFDSAKNILSKTTLIAPAYFILGGTRSNQGCVITRSREAPLQTRCLNESTWFVLQTNYDYWKAPFFLDDRRTPALHCMNELTQKNVHLPNLYDVLSTRPMLNKLTVYTALMTVRDGHLEAWRRDCPDPCPPW